VRRRAMATTAEQGGSRGDDADREQPGEGEQADASAIRVSAPRPITGPASPMYAARKNPATASARRSGSEMSVTVSIAPLNISPAPTPATRSPPRKTPKLGDGTHTASVRSPMPASIVGMASARSW
jgi:hypothetical protein